MNKIFAYLDLLGFKNFLKEDLKGALMLFGNYQSILRDKIFEKNIGSFEYLLPFSDSIFIISSNPDKFIKQLCHFILDIFLSTSYAYKDEANSNLYKQKIKEIETKDNKVVTKDDDENWFPTLFRGAISFSDIRTFDAQSIQNGKFKKIKNMTGMALIEAIKLEGSFKELKGPRILCNKEFFNAVSEDLKNKFFDKLNFKDKYEILWPVVIYDSYNFKIEINEFENIFTPAVNLWKFFNHKEYGIHYFELVKLIIRSTIKFFEDNFKNDAIEYISKVIKNSGLQSKEKDLLDIDL